MTGKAEKKVDEAAKQPAKRSTAATASIRRTDSIFDQMERMQDRITRRAYELFNGNHHGGELDHWFQAERELVWKPAIELTEDNNQFHLRIAVPGVDPRRVNIEVTPGEILVTADLQRTREETRGTVHTCEFASGNLFRAVRLPKTIDPARVKAQFKNGMLLLTANLATATGSGKA